MPIYSYRCESCEHTQDVLQKISDLPLAVCPACGASAFKKQVTAAGFQLKGSGWYATDFRNPTATKGKSEKDAGSAEPASGEKAAQGNDSNAKEKASSTKTSEASSPASDKSSASPSPSPAPSTPSST